MGWGRGRKSLGLAQRIGACANALENFKSMNLLSEILVVKISSTRGLVAVSLGRGGLRVGRMLSVGARKCWHLPIHSPRRRSAVCNGY